MPKVGLARPLICRIRLRLDQQWVRLQGQALCILRLVMIAEAGR